MLALSAQDLDAAGHLRSVSDFGSPQHAVGADVNTATDLGLRMSEEGTELNAASERAFLQSKPVVRDSKIIAQDARRRGEGLCEHHENRLQPAEP